MFILYSTKVCVRVSSHKPTQLLYNDRTCEKSPMIHGNHFAWETIGTFQINSTWLHNARRALNQGIATLVQAHFTINIVQVIIHIILWTAGFFSQRLLVWENLLLITSSSPSSTVRASLVDSVANVRRQAHTATKHKAPHNASTFLGRTTRLMPMWRMVRVRAVKSCVAKKANDVIWLSKVGCIEIMQFAWIEIMQFAWICHLELSMLSLNNTWETCQFLCEHIPMWLWWCSDSLSF